jgi:tetratricopeptide (TPR) repeat protein
MSWKNFSFRIVIQLKAFFGRSVSASIGSARAPLWQALCLKSFVGYERYLMAAVGYAELDMIRESIAELNAIDDTDQNRPEVLHLRLHNLMRRKSWNSALRVSNKLCRVAPECSTGFLHAGFCLHELGRTAEAKKILLKGPTALLNEPIYYYNMGCYDALLGNIPAARIHLQTSFKMDASFRELAKRDPDLKSVQELL